MQPWDYHSPAPHTPSQHHTHSHIHALFQHPQHHFTYGFTVIITALSMAPSPMHSRTGSTSRYCTTTPLHHTTITASLHSMNDVITAPHLHLHHTCAPHIFALSIQSINGCDRHILDPLLRATPIHSRLLHLSLSHLTSTRLHVHHVIIAYHYHITLA